MKHYLYTLCASALSAAVLVVGCNKQERVEAPRFDPEYIAAEADKGNLGPLTEVNEACSAEVKKNGRRLAACAAQDQVRDLRKPVNIRF
ncbi:hypothetical protein [Xenophilus azovorans]|uniref:hypothetical protein n=1 Tax=Xenophilus azovorans TaxID=151755 RepID=UPI00056F9E42|nr:hypothetical protein [Xenophilus azovorans]